MVQLLASVFNPVPWQQELGCALDCQDCTIDNILGTCSISTVMASELA